MKAKFQLFGWLCITAVIFLVGCRSVSPTTCIDAQIRLWAAARAYAAERGLGNSVEIEPKDLIEYLHDGTNGLMCPISGKPYPPFSLQEGPRCLAGHRVDRTQLPWVQNKGVGRANTPGKN